MTINESGFLSPDISFWIKKHRTDLARDFDLATRLSLLGQRVLLSSYPKQDNEQEVLTSILFARALCHFQGTIILAERGMIPSARALARVMCEAIFSLCATANSAAFVKELVLDDRHRRGDLIRSLLQTQRENTDITEEEFAHFRSEEQRLREEAKKENPKRLGVYQIAEKAGLLSQYHLIYAPLSSTVHAAIRDLDMHIHVGDDDTIKSLLWGPDVPEADLSYPLVASIDVFFAGLNHTLQLFPNPDAMGTMEELWSQRKSLLETEKKGSDGAQK